MPYTCMRFADFSPCHFWRKQISIQLYVVLHLVKLVLFDRIFKFHYQPIEPKVGPIG